MSIEYKKMSIREFIGMSMEEVISEFGVRERNFNQKYFINAMGIYIRQIGKNSEKHLINYYKE